MNTSPLNNNTNTNDHAAGLGAVKSPEHSQAGIISSNTHQQPSTQPVPTSRLLEIATEACDSTFSSVTSYEHSQTGKWNARIINTVLQSLISATNTSNDPGRHPYKFAITSTIIQHTSTPPLPSDWTSIPGRDHTEDQTSSSSIISSATSGINSPPPPTAKTANTIAKRGMHSATGAFWDNTQDGCWSFKYEREGKGFDVVVSVIWIAVDGV